MPATTQNNKLIVYQLLVRHFGNTKTRNKFFGSIKENGCGKFNDITDKALSALKEFGVTHVWYTGVLEHATLTDYSLFGIARDHPMIVKGIAGSPYAIKDYYDVDPDLAENVTMRISEFEALIHRTRENGLKSIIDFIPNHVARSYKSDQKPEGIDDFGKNDDRDAPFAAQNNYYYLPGEAFMIPDGISSPVKAQNDYTEIPAKATGNDVFSATPSVYDWYDTAKLNYGVDYLNGRTAHFDPLPDTWLKMRDILLYWSGKGVDGFRCDMAEMVPAEFWAWVIPQVKSVNPAIIFIAEIYNPGEYRRYIHEGGFDYLYDKVGLYDTLRRLIEGHGNADDITRVWKEESGDIAPHMLRFLENHDEQRIASRYFAGDPFRALPAMALSATLHTGPLMIYSGQEVGVAARDSEGYQGDDGRTTIYDYWGITELQAWVNKGRFDGAKLSGPQKTLRKFYADLNRLATENEAFYSGAFFDLQYVNFHGQSPGYDSSRLFSFLRYTGRQKIILAYNFDQNRLFSTHLRIPEQVWREVLGLDTGRHYTIKEIFGAQTWDFRFRFSESPGGIPLNLPPNTFRIWEISD
ncbi:MAG: alpha-amylase [Cytophagaceae bacterium SCN 52-12]|nr:MAG: alpha-amylase [Cytophagaceae bacterium SCN 52-12]